MTFFEWLIGLLASGALGSIGSAIQSYLEGYWPWLVNLDKVQKVAVQVVITLILVTGVYFITVAIGVTTLSADWQEVVNEIGTFALIAFGASQARLQAAKMRAYPG